MAKTSKVQPEHKLDLTSVKVHKHVLNLFQKEAFHVITTQKLLNRAMHMYTYDEEFRNKILNCTALVTSGSL